MKNVVLIPTGHQTDLLIDNMVVTTFKDKSAPEVLNWIKSNLRNVDVVIQKENRLLRGERRG